MAGQTTQGARPPVREVQHSLRAARDEQITRVVAMVDGLADRSAADALIAPLRSRLAQLRPPRPLRLARLLLLPLDPLIVPAPRWRPGKPTIPRTALTPLADVVRAGDPEAASRADADLAGRTTHDPAAIATAGSVFWPAAARVLLASAEPPARWAEMGLPAAEYAPLARSIGSLLEHAEALQRMAEDGRHGLRVEDSSVDAVLAAVASPGREAWSMAVALLFDRLADPAPIVRRLAADLALSAPPATRARAEQATDALLERLDAPGSDKDMMADIDLSDAGAGVRRMALLLDALEGPGATAARRKRVQALRRQLDASTQARFHTGIEQIVALPPTDGGTMDAATIGGMESAARALRDLETAGRRLGGGPTYDRLLRQAADRIGAADGSVGLTRADKLRMAEILVGPDQAMALLAA